MKYKLMIKTHNITGMKYLCITSRDDYESYSGSGVYWKKHLKKYGNDFSTILLFSSDDYDIFLEKCFLFSIEYDVVLNEEFANLIPEHGYTYNFSDWWTYATQSMKSDVYRKRSESMFKFWKNITDEKKNTIKQKISDSSSKFWKELNYSQRMERLKNLNDGCKIFHENKDALQYIQWKEKLSTSQKKRCANLSFDYFSERNRKSRLSLSEDKKIERKKKIQAVYNSGKHDEYFKRLSIERKGSGNPAAKSIEVDGVLFGSVQEAARETGIPSYKLYRLRKNNAKINVN